MQTDTEVKHCLSLFLSQNPAAGGNPPQSLDLKVQEECLTIPSPAQPIFLRNSRRKMGLSQPFFPFPPHVRETTSSWETPMAQGTFSLASACFHRGIFPPPSDWPQASFIDTCCRASLNHSMASDERDLKDHPDPNHLPPGTSFTSQSFSKPHLTCPWSPGMSQVPPPDVLLKCSSLRHNPEQEAPFQCRLTPLGTAQAQAGGLRTLSSPAVSPWSCSAPQCPP